MTQFNMKEALAKCREAYTNGTLQFQGPAEVAIELGADIDGCMYFYDFQGTCYTCAVGSMVTEHKEDVLGKSLNQMTGVETLLTELMLVPKGYNQKHIDDLGSLQRHHDEAVQARCEYEKEDDLVDKPVRLDTYNLNVKHFETTLERLEKEYA